MAHTIAHTHDNNNRLHWCALEHALSCHVLTFHLTHLRTDMKISYICRVSAYWKIGQNTSVQLIKKADFSTQITSFEYFSSTALSPFC